MERGRGDEGQDVERNRSRGGNEGDIERRLNSGRGNKGELLKWRENSERKRVEWLWRRK